MCRACVWEGGRAKDEEIRNLSRLEIRIHEAAVGWGRLHAVRSGLSFLAFVIFLFALRHKA